MDPFINKKKYICLTFCLFMFVVNGKAQSSLDTNNKYLGLNTLSSGLYYEDSAGNFYTIFKNGNIESIGKFIRIKALVRSKYVKDGLWKYYYPNKKIKEIEYYEKGKLIYTKQDEK